MAIPAAKGGFYDKKNGVPYLLSGYPVIGGDLPPSDSRFSSEEGHIHRHQRATDRTRVKPPLQLVPFGPEPPERVGSTKRP